MLFCIFLCDINKLRLKSLLQWRLASVSHQQLTEEQLQLLTRLISCRRSRSAKSLAQVSWWRQLYSGVSLTSSASADLECVSWPRVRQLTSASADLECVSWPRVRQLTSSASADLECGSWPRVRQLTSSASADIECVSWHRVRAMRTVYANLVLYVGNGSFLLLDLLRCVLWGETRLLFPMWYCLGPKHKGRY